MGIGKSDLDENKIESGKSQSDAGEAYDFDINDEYLNQDRPGEDSVLSDADKNDFGNIDQADMTNMADKVLLEPESKATSATKKNLIIMAVAIVVLVVFSVFGYFLMKVLDASPSAASPDSFSSVQDNEKNKVGVVRENSFADIEKSNGNEFGVIGEDADELAAVLGVSIPAQATTQQPHSENIGTQPIKQAEPNPDDILITQGSETLKGAESKGQLAQGSTSANQVSEEDRLYDSLLSSVENMDVPPEAIKIDQNVINRRLENQRIVELEREIKETRNSMESIQGAVESIRNQVGSFSQVIEKNSTDQARINDSIAKLTQEFKQLNATQGKELKAIKAEVARVKRNADQSANRTVEVGRTAQAKPVAASQPAPAPLPPQLPATQATVNTTVAPSKVFEKAKVPATVQLAAQADVTGASLPAHCDGSRVSANWRVKGVNNQSAYVVRTQDQQGMYLKIGVDVPGFGQVQGFDANSRAVCTTNGLIRR